MCNGSTRTLAPDLPASGFGLDGRNRPPLSIENEGGWPATRRGGFLFTLRMPQNFTDVEELLLRDPIIRAARTTRLWQLCGLCLGLRKECPCMGRMA